MPTHRPRTLLKYWLSVVAICEHSYIANFGRIEVVVVLEGHNQGSKSTNMSAQTTINFHMFGNLSNWHNDYPSVASSVESKEPSHSLIHHLMVQSLYGYYLVLHLILVHTSLVEV